MRFLNSKLVIGAAQFGMNYGIANRNGRLSSLEIESILDFYNQYKEEFKLNKNIFMGRYIVIDKSAPKLKKLSKWYKSEKEEHIIELEDYCQQFAKEIYLADSNWQYFSVINNKLPEIDKGT